MIRPAEHKDIDSLLDLSRALHEESDYSKYPLSTGRLRNLFAAVIDSSNQVVFVSEQKGGIVGGIMGGIAQHWACDFVHGYDMSLFILPARRSGITAIKLITAFEAWCEIKGANAIRMGITTKINIEQTSQLYQSLGFEAIGPVFEKRIG